MYQVFKRCNNLSYNGKENDINVWENIKEDIKNYNFLFLKSLRSPLKTPLQNEGKVVKYNYEKNAKKSI